MDRHAFEKHLQAKYPNLYCDMHGDMRKTCMAWGIDTGPGWYPLIEELSIKLEELIVKLPEEERTNYKAAQVKEKFGALRFYLAGGTKEMYDLVYKAEDDSAKVCETCGCPAQIRGDGWMRAHCDGCEKEYQAKRKL